MAEEKNPYDKALKVFRLEATADVSVSEPGMKVQSVPAEFIPLDNEDRLRLVFESAGLALKQVAYALAKLKKNRKA
jgi:hypothetical protein